MSDSAAINATWGQGKIRSGLADVDSLFADNGAIGVTEGSPGYYSVEFREPLNMRRLTELAAPLTELTVVDADAEAQSNDIELDTGPDGANAWFFLGWGDCAVRCDGTHTWTISLPPDGTAALVSESGDELPQYVLDRIDAYPAP